MLAVLWLIVWATVGEGFYDDYNWYSSDDGVADAKPIEAQRNVRENFSATLRTFADSYGSAREGDDEHTLAKVKSKLRLLRVFKYTGNSKDFESSRGQVLPLDEGAPYCTMGRHTKVDCNYCTCVAGQLYMCTGMICPPPPGRPQFVSTCREGKKRKIDSCNYCYCRNGHEICSTRDCRLNHYEEHFYLRLRSRCRDGVRRKRDCNRCICRRGEEYCTAMQCPKKKKLGVSSSLGPCFNGQKIRIRCRVCKCKNDRWHCEETKSCPLYKKARKLLWPKCKEGVSRKIDACNSCYCVHGREICEDNDCEEEQEQGLPFYRRLRHYERPCVEGSVFKVDSCNYCICLNGTETCTSTSCSDIDSESSLLPACKIGSVFQIDSCNYCSCPNGAYVCTNKPCTGLLQDNTNLLRRKKECDRWDVKFRKCNRCECHANRWICSQKICNGKASEIEIDKRNENQDENNYFYLETCSQGDKRKLDDCNICYCRNGQWLCQTQDCEDTKTKKDKVLIDLPALKLPVIKKSDVVNFFQNIANGFQQTAIDTINTLIKDDTEEDEEEEEDGDAFHVKKNFKPEKHYVSPGDNSAKTKNMKIDVDPEMIENKIHTDADSLITFPEHEEPTLVVDDPPCKSGSRKPADDCNQCICRRGLWFCENKHCGPIDNLPKDCLKGRKIEINCIPCICLSPKKGWKCHEKRVNKKCLQHRNKLKLRSQNHSFFRMNTCIEGSRRKVDACNYCICQNDAEYCTQKPCSSDTISSLISSEPECLEGHPVPAQDPCNTCICHNSDILCTNNPCILRKSERKKKTKCVGGQKTFLPDGCNYCICHAGQDFCTIRACLSHGSNDTPNGCNEGEVTDSGDNCNMCVCIKGKTVCTKKDCSGNSLRDRMSNNLFTYFRKPKHKMAQGTKPKCDPNKTYLPNNFDPNCPNECICDRNELLCTKRKCFHNWNQVTTPFKGLLLGKIEPLNRISAHLKHEACVEFQPLPSDDPCNSCICLNERKVCTIIACSDDNDEIDLGSDELIFKNSKFKGNKGNMMKKKNAFCEPFTFYSPENNRFCRNCFCLHNGLALCLLNLCKYNKDIPHQSSPEELTEVCTPGEKGYPTKCVTCTCSEHGKWVCTREDLALCQERDCDEKDEFHMGFFPYCAGCKCSVKEWFCSIQGDSCTGNATCPLGTFIHNPRQHCSICLCGGYEEGSHNMCFTEAKCVRQVISRLRV